MSFVLLCASAFLNDLTRRFVANLTEVMGDKGVLLERLVSWLRAGDRINFEIGHLWFIGNLWRLVVVHLLELAAKSPFANLTTIAVLRRGYRSARFGKSKCIWCVHASSTCVHAIIDDLIHCIMHWVQIEIFRSDEAILGLMMHLWNWLLRSMLLHLFISFLLNYTHATEWLSSQVNFPNCTRDTILWQNIVLGALSIVSSNHESIVFTWLRRYHHIRQV